MKLPENFVVVDCETSGLSPERHALLAVGAITTTGAEFYRECLFDEYKAIDPEAMRVNGIALGLVNAHDVFPATAVKELCDWLGDQAVRAGLIRETCWIMGGKNPKFDWDFLTEVVRPEPLLAVRLQATISRRGLDLHSLAYWWGLDEGMNLAVPGFKTQQIYARLGFAEEPWPHNARNGARLEMEIFKSLAQRQHVPPEKVVHGEY